MVSTIACPGWSLENERRYLIDHLPEILPDVILYIASNNDLDDGFEILENGHRVPAPDPAATARLPHCSIAYHYSMAGERAELFPAIPYNPSGYALYTGVTPESRRRYAGAVNGLVDLQGRVSNRGGKLGIVFLQPDPLDRRFAQFLRAGAPALPILTLFDSMRPVDALKDDPHPNAACVRAAAWRVARFLVDQHWVPGAGARPLPAEDPNYRGRVAKDPTDAELASERAAWDSIALARLVPRIDFKTGAGWEQI